MPRKKGTKKTNLGTLVENLRKVPAIEGANLPQGTPFRLVEGKGSPTTVYKVTLKSVGRIYKSEGVTLEEAIGKIKVMGGVKVMAVLLVEKGDQRKERIINGQLAQKLFGAVGPTMKEIAFKQITQLVGL